MKKLIGIIALTLILGGATAQVMQQQPIGAILQKMKSEGFIALQKIELINGEYDVQALDKDGRQVLVRINSHNADIIETRKLNLQISMQEVIDKIEGVGYSGISRIEAKNSLFEVDAINSNGKKVKLSINSSNGQINKIEPYTTSTSRDLIAPRHPAI